MINFDNLTHEQLLELDNLSNQVLTCQRQILAGDTSKYSINSKLFSRFTRKLQQYNS
jgi:hypothetical protein